MKLKVLVTGAAGFLGSHLTDKLLEQGHEVIGVDNLLTGKMENLNRAMALPAFRFIQHDITQPLFIPVDRIFNFACPASPIHYQTDPVATILTNVLGVTNMCRLAAQTGAMLFQASTSEVYGDPLITPQAESYNGNVNPIGPRACYDEGKRAAETIMFDFHRQHGVAIKVVRIFNTYGPRMSFNDGRVVSNFVLQAIKGKPLTIYGDGNQTRSFCYVDDLIRGILDFSETNPEETGPMNLGTNHEVTMKRLAELVLETTNSKSALESLPLPADDPKQRQPNLDLAQRVISWKSEFDLKTGLEMTIRDFQGRLLVEYAE